MCTASALHYAIRAILKTLLLILVSSWVTADNESTFSLPRRSKRNGNACHSCTREVNSGFGRVGFVMGFPGQGQERWRNDSGLGESCRPSPLQNSAKKQGKAN
ncbi:hypothetical protein WUBG_06858 [Wuchereria bancrofti]|uniref:Secreted protein n=1 Tax=Wuchereria bancrofti TaxID=6293 RepID=J9EIG2_WUCBA|nr:hypothetical protein WUBG_06858 [Wuchereria bancrofti]